MSFRVEIEQENDGRWIEEVIDLPGVLAYGNTAEEAQAKVQALALRVVADRLEPVKLALSSLLSLLRPHEPVVQHACPACLGCTSSNRLKHQTTIWFSPHTFSSRLAGFRIRLSRQ
jgi:predicted RNase H-like HicB family nuclease